MVKVTKWPVPENNKNNLKLILHLADIRDILIFAMEKRSRKKGAGGSLLLL
jgi:hypothetical protein